MIRMTEPLPSSDPLEDLIQQLPLDELAFTPVPVKPRHDGWTPERQTGFIHRLALCGCVAAAAREVGMTKKSAYRLRDRAGAESFAAAWERALDLSDEWIDHTAIMRIHLGERVPIFYRGRQVGERVRHNDRLLAAALEARNRREHRKEVRREARRIVERTLAELRREAGDDAAQGMGAK